MIKKISIAVLIAAIIIIGWSVLRQQDEARPTASTLVYENAELGYSLSYPAELEVTEYPSGTVAFGDVAEVRTIVIEGDSQAAFMDAAAEEMRNLCAADGPTQSFSCTAVEQVQPFTADSGLSGFVFYLRGELTHLGTGEVTNIGKGPYFAMLIGTGATASRAIIVHPPLNVTADEADSVSIRLIAESIEVQGSENASGALRAYMDEFISDLSPVKEQLGGTFYVTSMEARDGAGVVSYEDGHNAYTADFTYSIDDSGNISIDAFTVRDF